MQLTNKKYKQHQYFATYIEESGKPYPLAANKGKSFQGSIVLGKGFLLLPEDAQKLIEKDPRNKDVLFPYLNGDDLNNDPEQKPSRWVINFFDWDEEKAKTYPDCYEIVERLVKPERMKLDADKSSTNKKRKTYWWQYGSDAKSLYNTISGLEQVMLIPRVSKYLIVTLVPSKMVFMDKVVIISNYDYNLFALLQSSIYDSWVWKYTSTLGSSTINFSPSDCFENFPLPNLFSNSLEQIGSSYSNLRKLILSNYNIGLTKLYNAFHSNGLSHFKSNDKQIDFLMKHLEKMGFSTSFNEIVNLIKELRRLHIEMDEEVIKSFGWVDINLKHGFYEVEYLPANDNVRFTIHPTARREILKRLLLLNHERHKAEIGELQLSNSPKKSKIKVNKSSNLLF